MPNLLFSEIVTLTKTKLYNVYSAHGDATRRAYLGRIKWYCAWRRYVFIPYPETLFDAACLTEVTTFITDLMTARKQST